MRNSRRVQMNLMSRHYRGIECRNRCREERNERLGRDGKRGRDSLLMSLAEVARFVTAMGRRGGGEETGGTAIET